MSTARPPSPDGTQSIQRALLVLRTLADAGELTITQIAARCDLNAGTAARIARALTAGGLVRRNPVTDGYHLGAGAVVLGAAARRTLGLDQVRPFLDELGATTGESVNLATRDGAESVVMLRVQSQLPLRFEQRVGARFPLYSTASGKAMLAFDPDRDDYLASLPESLPPVAPGTLATLSQLRQQLDETAERGWAIDIEENVEGVRCVGAPVRDAQGRAHAAVVVQAPGVRLSRERIDELGPLVARIADQVAGVVPDPTFLHD